MEGVSKLLFVEFIGRTLQVVKLLREAYDRVKTLLKKVCLLVLIKKCDLLYVNKKGYTYCWVHRVLPKQCTNEGAKVMVTDNPTHFAETFVSLSIEVSGVDWCSKYYSIRLKLIVPFSFSGCVKLIAACPFGGHNIPNSQ